MEHRDINYYKNLLYSNPVNLNHLCDMNEFNVSVTVQPNKFTGPMFMTWVQIDDTTRDLLAPYIRSTLKTGTSETEMGEKHIFKNIVTSFPDRFYVCESNTDMEFYTRMSVRIDVDAWLVFERKNLTKAIAMDCEEDSWHTYIDTLFDVHVYENHKAGMDITDFINDKCVSGITLSYTDNKINHVDIDIKTIDNK